MTLHALLEFNSLLLQLQRVERVVYVPGTDRFENDFEHGYQLAMLAWYIIENDKLSFDKDLVLKYALVHDFVEVHAGDTYFYGTKEELGSKKEREAQAAVRLRKELPGFPDLHTYIEQYEEQKDAESRFVYVLDKIVPIMNIYRDKGRTWQEQNVSLAMLIEKKASIMEQVPELKSYFDEFVALLEKQPKLFPKK